MTSWPAAGVHWEHLVQTRGAGANSKDLSQWLGPCLEARGGPGYVRFSGGVDLTPDDVADFHRAHHRPRDPRGAPSPVTAG